jgi:apolipoprotein N-acyltransferase
VTGLVEADTGDPEPEMGTGDAATGRDEGDARTTRRARLRTGGLAVGAGIVLCLSLPPFGWWPLSVVGLVVVDQLVADQPRRSRFARGVLVSAGLFVPSLVWISALTVPGYVIAAALYSTVLGAGIAAAPPGRGRWLALPGTWALVELARWSVPFGGVPLSNLAIGQVAGPLAPVLRLGGALLLLVTTLVLGMAAAAAVRRRWAWAGALAAGAVVAVVVGALAPKGHDVGRAEVALVQGGGPQGTRKTATSVIEVFERHVDATAGVEPPVDLVVWPEDVVDTDGPLVEDRWAGVIADLARSLDAPMVVGAVEGAGPDHFRNAAVLFDADGSIDDRYEKVHRVPFGEFTPLRSVLEPIAGDALQARDAIAGTGPAQLDTPIGRAAVAISWEVFFGDRAREGVGNGAAVILNPTNGASFTGTIVQTQQIASSRMRAIENGRWVLQVSPTGFSAVIDADGDVLERSAISEARVLQREVALREGTTVYTRVGFVPGVVLALAGAIAGWAVELRDRRGVSRRPGRSTGRRARRRGTPDRG